MALSTQEADLLRETRDAVVKTKAHMETCIATIERHEKVLFGNSSAGLVSRVRMMWWMLTTITAIVIAIFGAAGVAAWVR